MSLEGLTKRKNICNISVFELLLEPARPEASEKKVSAKDST